MDVNVPYMPSVKNLKEILTKIQKAAVPERFTYEFLTDLGFKSSNDKSILKVLKYLGFLGSGGEPQTAYREYVNESKSKQVMAQRLRIAFDDLYASNKSAHTRTVDDLKGWFKTKTGKSDSVAMKIATTFKTLASTADFSNVSPKKEAETGEETGKTEVNPTEVPPIIPPPQPNNNMGLVYRIEIHLPDTQNIETHRAIFKALKEELM